MYVATINQTVISGTTVDEVINKVCEFITVPTLYTVVRQSDGFKFAWGWARPLDK